MRALLTRIKQMENPLSKQLSNRPKYVLLENVRIGFRNFSGKEGKYNREGDRNFNVFLEPDQAERFENEGWNVKYLKPRDEDDQPQAILQVTVSYKGRPPTVVMITSRGRTALSENEVDILDWADLRSVDMTLNPYHWTVSGKSGVKAYLKSIYVTIEEDELDLKYADVPDSAQNAIAGRESRLAIEGGQDPNAPVEAHMGDDGVYEIDPPW